MTTFLATEARLLAITNKTSQEYQIVEAIYNAQQVTIKDVAGQFFDKVMIVSYLSFLPLFYGI